MSVAACYICWMVYWLVRALILFYVHALWIYYVAVLGLDYYINNILAFVYVSSFSAIQIKKLVSTRFHVWDPGSLYVRPFGHQQCSTKIFFLEKKNKINESGFVFRGYMCNSFHASNLQLRDMTTCRILIWSVMASSFFWFSCRFFLLFNCIIAVVMGQFFHQCCTGSDRENA